MASTVARNQQDVKNMTAADRLWDSMNYTYGTAREDLAKQYRQAYSQADRQMLGRGMQRSSYGAQTLANIQQEGLRQQENNWNQQIADYENRLQDIENQEWQRDFSERQFNEGVRQYEQNFNYQQGRDTVADQQWQMAFDQNKGDNDRSLAASYVNAIIAKGQMPTDDLLNRAGLSREDAIRLLNQQPAAAGASGPTNPKPGPGTGDEDKGNNGLSWNDFMNSFGDLLGGNKSGTGNSYDPYSNFINGLGNAFHNAAQGALKATTRSLVEEQPKIKMETKRKGE